MSLVSGYPNAPTPEELWDRAEGDPRTYVGYLAYHGYLNNGYLALPDPLGRPYLTDPLVDPPVGLPVTGPLYPRPGLFPSSTLYPRAA